MSLRIIKSGSAKTAAVQPFFLASGHAERRVEPYILPEFASDVETDAVPESSEPVAAAPVVPPVDIEKIEKDAFARGHAAGLNEGLNKGLKTGEETAAARIAEITKRYSDSLAEFATYKTTLRAQVEEDVVRLSIAIAKKLVHREIRIDPTIIHTLVRVALERTPEKSAVVVRLSSADYEYMNQMHADMLRSEGRDVKFESDGTLRQGDCVIHTETGDIDARIEEEFHEVESAFFEGL